MNHSKKLIPAALAAAVLTVPAAAFAQQSAGLQHIASMDGMVNGQPGNRPSGWTEVTGTVIRDQAGVLKLQSGQDVYINPDTVIDPKMSGLVTRIHVTGLLNTADGSIEATKIEGA